MITQEVFKAGKESACTVRNLGLIPGLGRLPGEEKGYPLQHSGLENYMACGHKESDMTERLSLSLGEGHGSPLQYSFLQNPMGKGAWWATVPRVAKSQTQLSDFHLKI